MKEQYASLDDLQFGFKENSSNIICTQLLVETIEYYNSNNTGCFMLLLMPERLSIELNILLYIII